MASDLTLYWIPGSPPSWRVMIVLAEKELNGYNSKKLSWEKREHKTEEVLNINPRGEVPTFRDGDTYVNESLAICQYLENKFKEQGARLLPDDHKTQAHVLQRMHEVQNLEEKVLSDYGVMYWMQSPLLKHEDIVKKRLENARNEIARWEAYLEKAGEGSYIAGSEFTLADVALVPWLGLMQSQGCSLDSRPNLKRYYDFVCHRPSIKATKDVHNVVFGPKVLQDL